MSARGTRATDELTRAGVAHVVREYEPPVRHGAARDERPSYGLDAAAALGVEPARIFKTLVATVDDRLAVAIVPVAAELDLKRLADVLGGRRAALAEPAAAERATGYVIGGISPIGGRRRLPAVLDASLIVVDAQQLAEVDAVVPIVVDAAEPLSVELQDFCKAVTTGITPRSSAAIGLEVVRMIEAVDRSRELGGTRVAVNELDPIALTRPRTTKPEELPV